MGGKRSLLRWRDVLILSSQLCDRGSHNVAVLSHAGLFGAADNYLSGNLVPVGEVVPPGMQESMVLVARLHVRFRSVLTICRTESAHPASSATIRTRLILTAMTVSTDYRRSVVAAAVDAPSPDEQLQKLEAHIEKVPGFNPTKMARTDYQSGADSKYTHRFRMRAPIFIPRPRDGPLPSPPIDCHPWILESASKSPFYAINPGRPRLFGLEDGRVLDLAKCTPNRFVKGDIILAVFTVTVVISKKHWGPQFCPVELVRVAESDPASWLNPADYAVPVIDSSVRASLEDGEQIEGTSGARHAIGRR